MSIGKKSNTPQTRAQENTQVLLELKALKEQNKKQLDLLNTKNLQIQELQDHNGRLIKLVEELEAKAKPTADSLQS